MNKESLRNISSPETSCRLVGRYRRFERTHICYGFPENTSLFEVDPKFLFYKICLYQNNEICSFALEAEQIDVGVCHPERRTALYHQILGESENGTCCNSRQVIFTICGKRPCHVQVCDWRENFSWTLIGKDANVRPEGTACVCRPSEPD